MTRLGWTWAISVIVALWMLPVGILRTVAWRSGEREHTPGMHLVARLALGVGGAAVVVFVATTIWFLVNGERPV